ncbi:MAG: Hsp20/alpha crystallin family protein [Vicingaceae bacterium]
MSLLVKRNGNNFIRPFPSVFSDFFDDDNLFERNYLKPALPAVNVKENKNNFEIELAAPGMKKDDFKVDVDNGVLSISSEKEESSEETEENYTRKEFSYSSFKRAFTLPDNVDNENIKAKYSDGVLGITLKKKKEAAVQAPKTISIQ